MYGYWLLVKAWKENSFLGITSFGKVPAVILRLTLRPGRKRSLKEANQHPLCIPLQWTQVALSATWLSKIAVVKLSNEPGSELLLAWNRANWVQETCLLIQATSLRKASLHFHRGLWKCFIITRWFCDEKNNRLVVVFSCRKKNCVDIYNHRVTMEK